MHRGRPRLFETEDAWEIYTNLPPEQRTYTNTAKELSNRLNLDPPLAAQAIASRFIKAGLVEKKPRGAPKLKENPMSDKARSRLRRYRAKVIDAIVEENFEEDTEVRGVGRPRQLETSVAVEAYKKLGSIDKVAEVIGFSYSTIRARLHEAGVLNKTGRPLLGDKPLSQVERNKKWKIKVEQLQKDW